MTSSNPRAKRAVEWAISILAAALVTGSVACTGSVVAMTPTRVPPRVMTPRPREDVELLGTSPKRPCIEVGVITYTPPRGLTRPAWQYADEVAYAIWSYAGRVGCDAVVLVGQQGTCLVYDGAPLPPPSTSPDDIGARPAW